MADEKPPIDKAGIQVIARAASILRAIEYEPAGLSLGELAARIELPRSTVQRIVSALTEEGILISAGTRAGVTLGPLLSRLAAAAIVDTERLARPVLSELSRSIGETVDLSVLQGANAVFVDQVVGTSRLVAISAVGESFPLHCTANGKAILSRLPAERRDRLLSGKLARYTPRTIVSRVALDRELARIAETGLAWDEEEHSDGICAVGLAFVDSISRTFALSVPMPASRFASTRDQVGEAVLAAGRKLISLIPGSS